jgi:hypothetical protein
VLDLLAPVDEFRRPYHFAACIVDQRNARGFAPRIDFHAQRGENRLLYRTLENDGKRVAAIDCCLALFQE